MQGETECRFLDVRTSSEYEQGHPAGAINVPWATVNPVSGQMAPNPDFAPTVQKHFPVDTRMYLSCQAGVRSLNACNELAAVGYENLVNVEGGYGGKRDPMGQVISPGWADSNLPVENNASTYEELCG